jgi:circadian clock protein KaiC
MGHRLAKLNLEFRRSGGIDDIRGGGLTPHRMCLIEGAHGTGKTTLAVQFLLRGGSHGQSGLYITLSETKSELMSGALSHGWDVSQFKIIECEVRHGTTVQLGLPMRKRVVSESEAVSDVEQKVVAVKRILLVEDDGEVRAALCGLSAARPTHHLDKRLKWAG